MPRHRVESPLPACYAVVHPGLEEVACDEIARDFGGEVKKCGKGIVAFRTDALDDRWLRLRTVEDVFLLAWGTDELTHRPSIDLDRIRRWTQKAPWDQLLRLHHAIHPKPKGKPTFRLVTQMTGEHGYRRFDAGEALAGGLAGVFPASWRPAEENAAVEVWLTIHGKTAVCGLRLSERTMRHRAYKVEHLPASLRPSVAAAMVRLGGASPGQIVLDPMCGAGTLLAEQVELARARSAGRVAIWGGDQESNAIRAAAANLRPFRPDLLARWDVRRLPLAPASVDRIVSNPPFGRQIGKPDQVAPLYAQMAPECDRVLKPGGRAVFIVGEPEALAEAVRLVGWAAHKQYRVKVLGLWAQISVWRKPSA